MTNEFNLENQAQKIQAWHELYCAKLSDFTRNAAKRDVPPPYLRFALPTFCGSKSVSLANYNRWFHRCKYFVPHIILTGDTYEAIVAHECCHAYAQTIMPESSWHGDFFYFLWHHILGFHDGQHNTLLDEAYQRAYMRLFHLLPTYRLQSPLKEILAINSDRDNEIERYEDEIDQS